MIAINAQKNLPFIVILLQLQSSLIENHTPEPKQSGYDERMKDVRKFFLLPDCDHNLWIIIQSVLTFLLIFQVPWWKRMIVNDQNIKVYILIIQVV